MGTTKLSIKWLISRQALKDIEGDFDSMSSETYKENVKGLRQLLLAYFSRTKCDQNFLNISPLGGAPDSLKAFKLRWARPGHGKSGGYRMIIVVDCDHQEVAVQRIFVRKNNPSDAEVSEAVSRGVSIVTRPP